ncbi:hypothetical protein CDAR_399201 [Caerostris darwini]|uniref:Uncharacterized protein n=1 Tax=Caerostris darwini TaxID=1538125 RepID=A0AAV4SVE9_9ARAC|nr:hypothetical protein CDAR_399201 [Caerostris darwini]
MEVFCCFLTPRFRKEGGTEKSSARSLPFPQYRPTVTTSKGQETMNDPCPAEKRTSGASNPTENLFTSEWPLWTLVHSFVPIRTPEPPQGAAVTFYGSLIKQML